MLDLSKWKKSKTPENKVAVDILCEYVKNNYISKHEEKFIEFIIEYRENLMALGRS